MDMRRARRLDDFLARGLGPAVGDVVVDGIVEQHRILRHDADGAAQAFLRDLADVLTIHEDAACGRVVEAEQQARQRGLARAA